MKTDPASSSSRNDQKSPKSGGGFFIAVGGVVGAILGVFLGQPSIGLLAGLGLGGLGALALWSLDR